MHGLLIRVTIILGAVLWPLCGFTGTENELGQAHLRGLPGVRVEVVFKTDESNSNLNEEKIQTDVELRLRLAGIPVLTEKEWKETTGWPSLRIYVSAVTRNEVPNIYAYHILVLLSELVRLERRMGNDPVLGRTHQDSGVDRGCDCSQN